jgi:hypothetical protein
VRLLDGSIAMRLVDGILVIEPRSDDAAES